MKNIIFTIIYCLFGFMMISAGLNKFYNFMPMPENQPQSMIDAMNAFVSIKWILPLVGIVEVIGGLLFIIPKTRALGAIVIFPIMIGILLTNIVNAPGGYGFPIFLLLINLWVIFENREKYLQMIK